LTRLVKLGTNYQKENKGDNNLAKAALRKRFEPDSYTDLFIYLL